MKRLIQYTAIPLFVMMFVIQAHGAAKKWDLDPAHSGIYFSVKHIHSTTRGYFKSFSGTVVFSPDDLAGSRLEFEVEVKSIDTGNTKRDGHLNSADFFDSKKYPKMTFKSTAITHVKDDQYTVEGVMTVKDVSKPVSVPFTFMGIAPSPFDETAEVAGFEATMTIDRLAYHVGTGKFYDMGVTGKEVEVLITLEAIAKK
jgi:polyisoprenoid-binding protein YceI